MTIGSMRKWIAAGTTALVVVGGGISLAACGTGTVKPHAAQSQRQAQPANPVPILSRTGARVPDSTVYGEVDGTGNRYATGYFTVRGDKSAEQVTAYTFASKADMQAWLKANPVSDTKIGIQGSGLWAVQVTGMTDNSNRQVYSVTPDKIAARVSGTLIGGPRAFTKVPASKPAPHIKPAPPAGTPVPAQPVPPAANADPVTVVQNFYDALGNHDYATAWDLGGKYIGGSDYNGWVAGYATTAAVYGTATDLGGGVVQVEFSAVQNDGSIKTFAGTYTVSGGAIVSADITQTS